MRLWPPDERFSYGPAYRYTVREYVVFEGLAENSAAELYPHPAFPGPALPDGVVRKFWQAVKPHRHLESWDAYRLFLQPDPDLPPGIGYKVGYQVVRSFLNQTGLTALAAHRLPYEEILPGSG